MNVSAVALVALVLAIIAVLGVIALAIWAIDASPKAIRARHARRPFTCPCRHDFVFHERDGRRSCTVLNPKCMCQGYSGEIPPPELAELLRGAP